MATTAHEYERFVRAEPEAVFAAISTGDGIARWWHGTRYPADLVAGADYTSVLPDGRLATSGTVLELEAPRRLRQTWSPRYAPALAAEPAGVLEWTVEPAGAGLTRLRLVHGELGRSPLTHGAVRHGWQWLLDNLKTVLETGEPLPAWEADEGEAEAAGTTGAGDLHRAQAVEANNSVWELLRRDDRSPDDDEDLLRRAYAAAYHWARTPTALPENEIRATYMVGRALLATGSALPALASAERMLEWCERHGVADFDLAYAHELRARALLALGDEAAGRAAVGDARAVPVADPEDREVVEQDLADL